MTTALPPQVDTRDCRLYRFWVEHPVTGERVLGYVGETVRQPLQRLIEHLYDQPWADTIIAWEVDDRVFAGKDAVLAAEKTAVEAERPLYNYEWNLGNPRRVEIWRAKQQRWARDDAAGRPRWVPPRQRVPGQAARRTELHRCDSSVRTYVVNRRNWEPWQIKTGLWLTSWVISTAVTWASLARMGWPQGWKTQVLCACLSVTVAMLYGLHHRPKRRRRRRRR